MILLKILIRQLPYKSLNFKVLLAKAIEQLALLYRDCSKTPKLCIPVYQEAVAITEELVQIAPESEQSEIYQNRIDLYKRIIKDLTES